MGGVVPLGYELRDRQLSIQPAEAERVQQIFRAYLEQGCVSKLRTYLEQQGIRSKQRLSRNGRASGGVVFSGGALYQMLQNRIYLGEITHKDKSFPGQQPAIIGQELWDRVQARMQANLQGGHKRPRGTEKSLLAGLLYDGQGNPFTPTIDALRMIEPPFVMSGSAFCTANSSPRTLMLKVLSKCSGVTTSIV